MNASAEPAVYFCPRAGVALEGETPTSAAGEVVLTLSGGKPLAFPKSVADLSSRGDTRKLPFISMKDCSTRQFFCKRVSQARASGPALEYILAVPRVIRAGRQYDFSGVRIVTRYATMSIDPDSPHVGTVTLWQQIDGQDAAIELFLETGRGVIYWDGVRLAADDPQAGETCALESKTGLFEKIRVR